MLAQATILFAGIAASHFAVKPWVSRQTWVIIGTEYVPSMVTSAVGHRFVGLALGLAAALLDVAAFE